MRVYKGKYGYSVRCSNKNEKDGDISCYLPVGFRKTQEPLGDKVDITVKDFFMTCYKKQDGTVAPKLFIMDYELDQEVKVNDEGIKEVVTPSTDLFITEEELPFY